MTPKENRGPGRPPASNSSDTRARILRAAQDVFSELGYQATTFQEIAQRADLTRPAINHYFSSKRDLYQAVVADIRERIIVVGLAEAQSEPTFAKRIRAFINAQARDPEAAAFLVISVLESERHTELQEGGGGALDSSRMFVRWILTEAAAAGELNPEADLDVVTEMLVAMLCGMGFYAGFGDGEEQVNAITDRFLTLLHGQGLLRID